eukprot:COSAG05_NODE_7894_length_758_cov_1.283763_2_plen_47_part_01
MGVVADSSDAQVEFTAWFAGPHGPKRKKEEEEEEEEEEDDDDDDDDD